MLVMAFKLIVCAVVGIGGLFGVMALLYLIINFLFDEPAGDVSQSNVKRNYVKKPIHNQHRTQPKPQQPNYQHNSKVTPFERYQQYQREREAELKNSRKVVDE